MADMHGGGGAVAQGGDPGQNIDWIAAERSPEFRELIKRKNAFIIPCTIFFFAWYFGFIILVGYAPDFMGERITDGLTVGYVIALTNFVMVWVLGALYIRQADNVFDPLAKKAAARAVDVGRAGAPGVAAEAEGGAGDGGTTTRERS